MRGEILRRCHLTHSSIQSAHAEQTSVGVSGCRRALARRLQLLAGPKSGTVGAELTFLPLP